MAHRSDIDLRKIPLYATLKGFLSFLAVKPKISHLVKNRQKNQVSRPQIENSSRHPPRTSFELFKSRRNKFQTFWEAPDDLSNFLKNFLQKIYVLGGFPLESLPKRDISKILALQKFDKSSGASQKVWNLFLQYLKSSTDALGGGVVETNF